MGNVKRSYQVKIDVVFPEEWSIGEVEERLRRALDRMGIPGWLKVTLHKLYRVA